VSVCAVEVIKCSKHDNNGRLNTLTISLYLLNYSLTAAVLEVTLSSLILAKFKEVKIALNLISLIVCMHCNFFYLGMFYKHI